MVKWTVCNQPYQKTWRQTLLRISVPGSFSVNYTTHRTYCFTSHLNDEAIRTHELTFCWSETPKLDESSAINHSDRTSDGIYFDLTNILFSFNQANLQLLLETLKKNKKKHVTISDISDNLLSPHITTMVKVGVLPQHFLLFVFIPLILRSYSQEIWKTKGDLKKKMILIAMTPGSSGKREPF